MFGQDPKAGHSWTIYTRDGQVHKTGWSNGNVTVRDYHNKAVLIAAAEAASEVPQGSITHFISNKKWFTDIVNRGRAARIASDYKRSSGNGTLAYVDEWRALDVVLGERGLSESAGPAKTEAAQRYLEQENEAASLATRNMHRSFGDWERSR